MSNHTTLRFGVVGVGHIGRRHLQVLDQEPEAELAAYCDTNAAHLDRYREQYPDARAYSSLTEMLAAEPALDIVCICTPHGLHAEQAIEVAQAGKHILVEKPMALTIGDSKRMIAAAQEAGVRLFVVKQNRYNKPVALVKKAIDDGALGRIHMVQCNVMWNRHQGYYNDSPWRGDRDLEGGALQTQVSHFIDLLVWWLGPLTDARALLDTVGHDIEIEDVGVAALRFESGTLGSLLWTTCVYNVNYEGSITILAENGTIKIGGKYLNEIEFWDVKSYPLPSDEVFDDRPNDYGKYKGTSSNHDKLIHQLVGQVIESRKGVVEGAEGMKTIQAIQMIYGAAGVVL